MPSDIRSIVDQPTPCIYCGKQDGQYVKARGGGTICIPCLNNLKRMGEEDRRQFAEMEKEGRL